MRLRAPEEVTERSETGIVSVIRASFVLYHVGPSATAWQTKSLSFIMSGHRRRLGRQSLCPLSCRAIGDGLADKVFVLYHVGPSATAWQTKFLSFIMSGHRRRLGRQSLCPLSCRAIGTQSDIHHDFLQS